MGGEHRLDMSTQGVIVAARMDDVRGPLGLDRNVDGLEEDVFRSRCRRRHG
jgi:hypothetical protein